MSWRDDLRQVTLADGRRLIGASFRGVPFLVAESERGGGRRIVVHEFPGRNDPYVEDGLGRKARTFRIQGYVLGADYLAQRDKLLTALEDIEGPGELIHPYYGTRRAVCGDGLSVRESIADGGMATFSIPFTEAPAQAINPTAAPDLAGLANTAATAAVTATAEEFEATYDPGGLPLFAVASAVAALQAASARVGATLKPVVTDTQELAALDGQLHLLVATASSLVTQPTEILDAWQAAFTNLTNTVEDAPGAMMDALLDACDVDFGPDVVAETTATRERERANQIALQGALRQALVTEAARLAPTVTFASIDDATAARDVLTSRLDELAAAAGDTVYPALMELRAAVVRALPGDTVHARVTTVTRRTAIPSLLLAYQLYGSVDREADILARNATPNPAFIAGDLKVLSE